MTVTGQWLTIKSKMTWATVISDPSEIFRELTKFKSSELALAGNTNTHRSTNFTDLFHIVCALIYIVKYFADFRQKSRKFYVRYAS